MKWSLTKLVPNKLCREQLTKMSDDTVEYMSLCVVAPLWQGKKTSVYRDNSPLMLRFLTEWPAGSTELLPSPEAGESPLN